MPDATDVPTTERTLVLLRHAKAEQGDSGSDADRPLTERGRADATAAGRYLGSHGLDADLVLCSAATRTRQTWRAAAAAGATAADVWYDRRIYEADTDELLTVLGEAPETARTVVLVGHGPGIPWLADHLARPGTSPERVELTQKYPTCGLAVLRHTTSWSSLSMDDCDLVSYVIPRG